MKKHKTLNLFGVICLLVLAACVGQAPVIATQTAVATLEPTKPKPTATLTPQPTNTITPTAQATLALGKRQSVDAGGYSLQIPRDFEAQTKNTQTTISNSDDTILMIVALAPRQADSQTVESVLEGFLANVTRDIPDFKADRSYPAEVGNVEGLGVRVTGTLFGAKNTGMVTVVETGKAGFFITFAFVVDGADGKRWESEGRQVFEAIVNSIEFFEPISVSSTGSCVIASDPNYGYTQEHAIKIGGDAFGGPARERAYLDNLAGPKGEKITYERTGSMNFGDTILDEFLIQGLGKPVTLYIDEYAYTEPQAPLGFTCLAAFPLSQP